MLFGPVYVVWIDHVKKVKNVKHLLVMWLINSNGHSVEHEEQWFRMFSFIGRYMMVFILKREIWPDD